MPTSSNTRHRVSRSRRALVRRGRAAAASVVVLPLALVASGGTALAATATPAARAAAALGEQAGAGVVLLRLALLVGTALAGGIALVHGVVGARRQGGARGLFAGYASRGLQVTAWVAAGVVAAAAEVTHLTGSVSVLGTAAHVVLALVAAALLGTRWSAAPGALLLVLLAAQLGSAHTGLAFALDGVYAVASGVLVGATAVAAAVSRRAGPAPGPRVGEPAVPAGSVPSASRVTGVAGVPVAGVLSAGVPSAGVPSAGVPFTGVRSRAAAEAPTEPFAAVARPPDDEGVAPRSGVLARVAITAGPVAVAAGIAQLLVSGPETAHDLTGSGYGLAGLAAVVLPALVVVGWLATLRPAGRLRERELYRIAGVAGVTGLAAAALLAALPLPGPGPEPGRPLLRTVDAGAERLAVLVAPMRPGPNLVRLSGTGYPAPGGGSVRPVALATGGHQHGPTLPSGASVSSDTSAPAVPFTARNGAAGGWAVVDLPAGASTLTVTAGGVTSTVPVDTGSAAATPAEGALTGPDGPECAAALLGDLVGQRPGEPAPQVGAGAGGCPGDALSEADAGALRATVRTLTDHGVRSVRVVADDSPRSRAAAELVRTRATEAGARLVERPDADSALIVVSGWAPAAVALQEASARALETPTHLGGTYLAPWLLTAGVVTRTSSSVVPLAFNPQDQLAQRYAGEVGAAFPGEAPSTSGYARWAAHSGVPLDDRPTLFGAAPVDVPMTVNPPGETDGHHGGGNPAAWFPNGTVVPVSAPLDPS
ncbi:hypothetical protein LWC33_26030 [Pseudonocardia sp. RS11V-5]|uniref:hypothetical protein n=1 Tax=Pseudonocardia terrae TaxID=2905831 RepID=UPI001E59159B|nr:hypothetical protein [Pseudonocardia terrae]MCE3554901.1 hypothetical protein [Pseudonocardia terrae]